MIIKKSTTDISKYDFYNIIKMIDVNGNEVEIPKYAFSHTNAQLNNLKAKYLSDITILDEKILEINDKIALINSLEV